VCKRVTAALAQGVICGPTLHSSMRAQLLRTVCARAAAARWAADPAAAAWASMPSATAALLHPRLASTSSAAVQHEFPQALGSADAPSTSDQEEHSDWETDSDSGSSAPQELFRLTPPSERFQAALAAAERESRTWQRQQTRSGQAAQATAGLACVTHLGPWL
jgi:hypothetical protein